ncbi:MAG: serine hydrolase [Rhabdochlamydiaceae bacterium]|nr:serine hydrolase [Candidatus Amphrikana amoebophyrae]
MGKKRKKNNLSIYMKYLLFTLITSITLSSTLAAENENNAHLELSDHIHSVVTNLNEKDQFSGAVLIAKNGDPIYSLAIGQESKEFNIENKLHTRFDLGYNSSIFTLIGICKLIDQGKLKLDDTINKYISSKLLPKVNLSSIKIIHLLTNSSGLGNMYNNQMRGGYSLWERSNKELYTTVNDYMHLVSTEGLSFMPGEKNQRSTTAILLLGAIIEEVSGESFYSYISKEVFKKANMNDSGFYSLSSPMQNIATGYAHKPGYLQNNLFFRAAKGSPASGAYTTVGDLLKFVNSLNNLSLTSKKMFDQIFTPYMKLDEASSSRAGIGPSESYQGLIFNIAYLDSVPSSGAKKPVGDKLVPTGIKELPSHRYIAHLDFVEPHYSVCIDMIEPSGYSIFVLSNYGDLGKSFSQSPSMMITSKVRRFILNSFRRGKLLETK